MERPFATILDVGASSVYLKLKYHNLQGESVTINVNLKGAKRIYKALQQYQGEGVAM